MDMCESALKYTGPTQFVHLHAHTLYSVLDGQQSPEQLFETCKDRGWPAQAVTEHGVLSSVPDCYFAAKANGVKFIAGCEIYFNDYEPLRKQKYTEGLKLLKTTDLDLHQRITRNRHLTVLAKNMIGFHNLVKLSTEAWQFGFWSKPRIWLDKLAEYREGLIILSGCMNGPVAYEIGVGNLKGARDYVRKFRDIWGQDYYIEVQMPCVNKTDLKIFTVLHKIAQMENLKVVLTNDAHYLNRADFEVQRLMMAIDQDVTIDSPDLFHVNSDEQFLKTREQLWETFKTKGYDQCVTDAQFEASCDNTLEVAAKCDPFKPNLDSKIPTSAGDVQKLKILVATELIRRGLDRSTKKYMVDNKSVTHKEQAKLELERFIEKGFASYFLITRELIQFSFDNGWPVGPRGSVGGSLVCYLLGITELDPLKWHLSFDRFLSLSRGGMMLNVKAK